MSDGWPRCTCEVGDDVPFDSHDGECARRRAVSAWVTDIQLRANARRRAGYGRPSYTERTR